jgi:hypothetical protein
MTKIETILFIEGVDNDPKFYEEIAKRYSSETGRKTDLREASELPNAALPNLGGAGGKLPLLRAATFLGTWRGRRPIGALGGKEIAFCVDKDIDDLLETLQVSPSVIYTPLNSVENHLVRGADLEKAVSIVLSVTTETVQKEIQGLQGLEILARQWKEWVIYCILATDLRVPRTSTFTRSSPLNVPAHTTANQALVASEFGTLWRRSAQPQATFDSKLQTTTTLVEYLIANNRFDEVFKGKWYVEILFSLCASCPTLARKCKKAGMNSLWIGIRSSFALLEADYQYYAAAIRASRT